MGSFSLWAPPYTIDNEDVPPFMGVTLKFLIVLLTAAAPQSNIHHLTAFGEVCVYSPHQKPGEY